MCLFRIYFLFIVIMVSMLFAFDGGNGTLIDPYQISNADDLEAINDNLNACYVLENDIDLTGEFYAKAVIAKDISTEDGFQGYGFTGILDGMGFKITIPAINGNDYMGLFGCIDSGGYVCNIGLEGGSITGQDYVAGIVALNFGMICESYSSCNINGVYYSGGIAGLNFGIISKSYSSSNVSGSYFVGGAIGLNDGYTIYAGKIINCYASGIIEGASDTGGLVGNNYGEIENCYSKGTVKKQTIFYDYFGGLVGWQSELFSTVVNSFWDTSNSGMDTSEGGEGKTSTEMNDPNTFNNANWDYVIDATDGTDDIWYQQVSDSPKLYWEYWNDWQEKADLNYDGVLNENDLVVFSFQWMMTQDKPRHLEADLNLDGFVDFLDYIILANKW